MNDFISVAIKLLIGFFSLIMVSNITGKGNLNPNSASDQVQNYVLGGIIGGIIYNKEIDILECIIILFIWCMLVLLFKVIKKHSVKARQLIDGKALIIIDNGQINLENCKKVGLCAHDVAFKLRTQNVYSTHKVKRAIWEQNGQLIVILFGEENPKFPIITDGHIQYDIVSVIGKDEEWLLEAIKKKGFEKPSDIFLGEYVDGELILTAYN